MIEPDRVAALIATIDTNAVPLGYATPVLGAVLGDVSVKIESFDSLDQGIHLTHTGKAIDVHAA